ncbi:hypothetical protein Tco_0756873 [Tanacetum coccineum]
MFVRYRWQSIQSFSIACNQNGANMLPWFIIIKLDLQSLMMLLYDSLVQFEPHVLASRAKKAAKNHDPLALIAHSNASSSHSHANSSYSPQPYYVTHPPSVVDYDDEYQGELQGDSQEDKLTTAMMLLTRAISQKFSTPTNNRLSYGGNVNKNAGRNRIQGFNTGNAGDESNQIIQVFHELSLLQAKQMFSVTNAMRKVINARECQKPKVRDAKYFKEQMLLAMKDEAGSNFSNEENDFMLDTSYGEDLEELTTTVMLTARPADDNAEKYHPMMQRLLARYLDDILDLEEKLSSHDRIVYKMDQSIKTIHMLGKKPNKVYDHFLKAGLGYTSPKHLKKAIAAQPKMYDGDLIHSNKLVIHSIDSEETLEDTEESRNKMRHKMVQIDYEKLNAFIETFVPYQTLSEIKEELIEEVQEMLNIFETMEQKVNEKSPTEILLQNEIDQLLEVSLTSEIRDCVLLSVEQQKHELLKVELEKSSSDSRDIQANLLKRIKILENDFQRSQAQSIAFELKLQHQKEKMACDVSWKAKLSTLHDENVLLKHQVESTVKERENIRY